MRRHPRRSPWESAAPGVGAARGAAALQDCVVMSNEAAPASESLSRFRGLAGPLTAVLVAAGLAGAAFVADRTGVGGQPYGHALVPVALVLLAAALALALRGERGERLVAAAVAALLGGVAGVAVAGRAPLAPAELERRARGLAGEGVSVERLTRSGSAACRPCARVDVVLRTPAGTVDEPLVSVLRALKREGLADVLLESSIRPDTSTARGRSEVADFALTAVPEYVEGRLTEVVALRLRARP